MFRHTHKLISLTVLTLLLSETNANVLASDTKIEQKLQNQVDQKTVLDKHKKHTDIDLVQTDQKSNSKGSSEQSHRRKHKRRHRHNSHKKHNKKKSKKDNFDKEPHTVSNKDDRDMSVKKAAEIEINQAKMKSLAQKPNVGNLTKSDNFDHDPTTVSEKDDRVKDLPKKSAKQAQVTQNKLSLVQTTEKKKEDSPVKEQSKEQKLVEVKQDKKQEKKETKTETKKSENKVEKTKENNQAQNSTMKIEDQGIGAKTALRIIEGKAATPISLPPNPIVQTQEALSQVFKGQDFTEGEDLISSFIVETDPHKPREVNSWLNNNIEKNQEEENE